MPTPDDGDDFLAANRENRAKARDEAAAKEAKAQAKRDRKVDADRVPRKLEADSPTPAARPTGGLLGRRRVVVGLLIGLAGLAIVLAGTTAYFGYKYADAREQLDQASPSSEFGTQAMAAAKQYAATIGTYDPDNYADLDQRIRAISTPAFADSYIAASQDARKGNANARGSSKAVSKEAGLESLSATKAVVLVTLDQTVVVPELKSTEPDGIPYQSRVKITLKRDDDRWLISDLDTV